MTTGRKTGGRNFQPGHQLSKGKGRPPLPDDLKGVTVLSQDAVRRQLTVFFERPIAELLEIANDPNSSSLHSLIAAVIINARKHGDPTRLDFLLNRCIGKVTDQLKVEQKVETGPPMTLEEARKILAEDYATQPPPPVVIEDL